MGTFSQAVRISSPEGEGLAEVKAAGVQEEPLITELPWDKVSP
jgi:hypothetical protein